MERIRQLFGMVRGEAPASDTPAQTESVRAILQKLEELPAERARYVAAFAYVLGRAAHADHYLSDVEVQRMKEILMRIGGLSADVAVLAIEVAHHRNEMFGTTDNFVVTREFRDISTVEERRELLDGAFAITAADDSISAVEEAEVRKIAAELGFSDPEYLGLRSKWNNKRDILKDWPSAEG